MKYLFGYSSEGWRRYALRMLDYGIELAALGLPYEHEERQRARRSYRQAREAMYREQRHINAAHRLMTAKKKALAAGRGRRNQQQERG